MAGSSTNVKIGGSSFDPTAIAGWIEGHLWVFLLIASVAFIFFIFQKSGFAEKYLDYRAKKEELDAKQMHDAKIVAEIFSRKHDRDDPLLPFDDVKGKGR